MTELLGFIPYPRFDPEIFRIGPFAVRWYALAYFLGLMAGYFWLKRLARRGALNRISPADVDPLIGWVTLGVIAGGRLGWWLVYHRSTGEPEPWYEPFAAWRGGMSFHGGLAGVMLAAALFAWSRKTTFRNVADALAIITPIGLCLGRLANFINGELLGRPSDLPWAMVFPGENFARHPSTLYEALLEGPLLLGILLAARRLAPSRDGVTAAAFLVAYGAFRFLVEFTRQPDAPIGYIAFGWLTTGQALSLGMVGVGIILGLYSLRKKETFNPGAKH